MREFWYRTVTGDKSLVISTENPASGHPLFAMVTGLILESQRLGHLPSPLSFTQFVGLLEAKTDQVHRIMNVAASLGFPLEVKAGTSAHDCVVLGWNDEGTDWQELLFECQALQAEPDSYRVRVPDMDFSVRAKTILAREGIRTVGELMGRTEYDLLLVNGLGVTTLKEIRIQLSRLGLKLRLHP